MVLNIFKSRIFPIRRQPTEKGIQISPPKQIFQRRPIAIVQVKVENMPQ